MDAVTVATNTGSWIWKEFGEDIKSGFGEFLNRKLKDAKISDSDKIQYAIDLWVGFQWGRASERYRSHLQKLYGQIRVLGSSEPVDFGDIFTDVHILDRPQAYRRFDISELQKYQLDPDKLKDEQRMPGLRVVQRQMGHRLYLLGKPGAGKTTFLKFLVHASLQDKLNKLPIFVTIKDWADSGLDLRSFIIRQFEICQLPAAWAFIEYLLENGRALLLCDGLDEVPQEAGLRARITSNLHDFCRQYYQTQMVITCRVAASEYTFSEFTYLEMADFDDIQVQVYARKWFHRDIDKAEGFLKELVKPENRGVRDLGRSPLLLSLICLTYDATLHIPQRRVELYEEALEALLKKWDSSRNIRRDEAYHKLSLGRKRQMFARLAAESFDRGEIFFPEQRLAHQIEAYLKGLPPADEAEDPDGAVILKAIAAQHGIFVERAQGVYGFAHLTFQEYYTAKYIAENTRRDILDSLMQHIQDQRWREVFLLTASLLDDANDLFAAMLRASANPIVEDKTLIQIQRWIERKVARLSGFRAGALRAIYFAHAITLARSRALDIAIRQDIIRNRDRNKARAVERAITNALTSALDLARALYLDLASILDLDLELELDRALDFSRARIIDHARTNDFDLPLDLDRTREIDYAQTNNLDRALNYLKSHEKKLASISTQVRNSAEILFFEQCLLDGLWLAKLFAVPGDKPKNSSKHYQLVEFFRLLKIWSESFYPEFSRAISGISVPDSQEPGEIWKQFEKTLRDFAIQYCDIGYEWDLSEEQIEKLTHYFSANSVLVECLKVAYVTDRSTILDKVLTVDYA